MKRSTGPDAQNDTLYHFWRIGEFCEGGEQNCAPCVRPPSTSKLVPGVKLAARLARNTVEGDTVLTRLRDAFAPAVRVPT